MLNKTNIANLLQKDYKQDQNPCLNQLSKTSSHCSAVLPEIKVKRETPCCFTNTECVTVFSTVGVLSSSWRFFGYFHQSRKPKFPSITLYLWWHTYRNKIRYSTMLRKNAVKIFHEYSQQVFLPFLNSQLDIVSRVDIVWYVYFPDSLKFKISNNWQEFLRLDENKSEHFFIIYHKNQLLLCVQKIKRVCPHLIKQYLLPHAYML